MIYVLKMSKFVTFNLPYDRLLYGAFPDDTINELEGITVRVVPIDEFNDRLYFTVVDDGETLAAVFVIGMYAQSLIDKFNSIKRN